MSMQTDLKAAVTSYEEGRFQTARNRFEQALKVADTEGQEAGRYKYALLVWLATIDLDMGHPNEARVRLDQAGELTDKFVPEEDSPDVAYTWARWNVMHRNYKEAREIVEANLDEVGRKYGRDSKQASDALLTLGRILFFSGCYGEAEEPLRKSLAIRKREFGDKSIKYADAVHYLASCYAAQGNRAAEPLAKVSMAIVQRWLPPTHIQVAENLHLLALMNQRVFKHEEAEQQWTRALSIAQEVLPENHPTLSKILCGLGTAKTSNFRFKEAEATLQRSLEVAEHAEEPNQTDILSSLMALGMHYFTDHQYEKAEPCLKRAIDMWEHCDELHSFGERSVLENLTVTYFFQGKVIDAMRLFPEIMRARYTSNAQGIFSTIDQLTKLAQRHLTRPEGT